MSSQPRRFGRARSAGEITRDYEIKVTLAYLLNYGSEVRRMSPEVRSTGNMLRPGNHEALAIDRQMKRSVVSRLPSTRGTSRAAPPAGGSLRGKVRLYPGVPPPPRKKAKNVLPGLRVCSIFVPTHSGRSPPCARFRRSRSLWRKRAATSFVIPTSEGTRRSAPRSFIHRSFPPAPGSGGREL